MKTIISILILIGFNFSVIAQNDFEFAGKWNVDNDGSVIQLDISKTEKGILIIYSEIYTDEEPDNYTSSEAKQESSNKLNFKVDVDGDICDCELTLSDDKQYINFKVTFEDGESQEIKLKKE